MVSAGTMPVMFDRSQGKLLLDAGASVGAGMSGAQIEAQGLRPVRDYPTANGAVMRSFEPRTVAGHRVYLTATTEADRLVRLSFSFLDLESLAPKEQQMEYCRFLEQELGSSGTSTHDGLTLTYTYTWGTILATYDPRNDSSGVYLSWNSPASFTTRNPQGAMMLTLEDARSRVEALLELKNRSRLDDPLAVNKRYILERASGWTFPYNTERFLKTGRPQDGTVGNGPVFVDRRTGELYPLPSGGWKQMLQEYEATGMMPQPNREMKRLGNDPEPAFMKGVSDALDKIG